MRLLLVLFILANTALAQPASDDENQLPAGQLPPLRVGNTIITVRHPTLQTGIVQDLEGTVYLLTVLGNGEKRLMRVSKKYVVRKLIMYQGWPYILTKKGKLYALNVSRATSLRNKFPAVVSRVLRKFPYAAATGAGFYGLSALNLWLHGGAPSDSITVQPETMGLTGAAVYYLIDATASLFLRTHYALGRGGNFFTTRLATSVKNVVPDKEKNDFRIIVNQPEAQHADLYISDIAPPYTNDSACILALTRLNLE